MRRMWIVSLAVGLAVLGLLGLASQGADAVEPASIGVTNVRDEVVGYASTTTFYSGATLRLTNCVMYAGTSTNAAVQGLDGVTIDVSIGNTSSNVDYVGSVVVTNLGTWWCDVVLPTWTQNPYLQVKITDTETNVYIYPWKRLIVSEAL